LAVISVTAAIASSASSKAATTLAVRNPSFNEVSLQRWQVGDTAWVIVPGISNVGTQSAIASDPSLVSSGANVSTLAVRTTVITGTYPAALEPEVAYLDPTAHLADLRPLHCSSVNLSLGDFTPCEPSALAFKIRFHNDGNVEFTGVRFVVRTPHDQRFEVLSFNNGILATVHAAGRGPLQNF
jgi:hypothetical protein